MEGNSEGDPPLPVAVQLQSRIKDSVRMASFDRRNLPLLFLSLAKCSVGTKVLEERGPGPRQYLEGHRVPTQHLRLASLYGMAFCP